MREALFAKVRAAPDDDGPRLVYADWLIENGAPARGELIIRQCRGDLSQPSDPLLWREVGVRDGRGLFRRGFLESVSLTYDELERAAPKLARAAIVREAKVRYVQRRTLPWSSVPGLDLLRSLTLLPLYSAELFGERASTDDLDEDVEPVSSYYLLGPSDMELLDLPALEELDVAGQQIGDDGLAVLFQRDRLRALTARSSGVELARELPRAERLRSLDLADNRLRGVEGLARSAPGLEELVITGARLESPIPTLRALTMQSARADARAVAALYDMPLERLDLSGNPLYRSGIEAILRAPFAPRLTSLALDSASETGGSVWDSPDALTEIARAPLSRLEHLRFSWNDVGPEGARALASSSLPSRLRTLVFASNRVGSEGARALARARWPALESIDLRDNRLTREDERLLADAFGPRLLPLR